MTYKFIFSCLLLLCFERTISAQQSVTFYANISDPASESGWIGHIWVGFNADNSSQKFGFYPEGLASDNGRKSDIDYTFKVTEQEFLSGLRVVDAYRKKTYTIGVNDCRGFAAEVARAIGLKLPSKGVKSPAEWMADLVDLNFR